MYDPDPTGPATVDVEVESAPTISGGRCQDCQDVLPYGWPIARCRACQEDASETWDDVIALQDALAEMPALQAAFLAWETRRLLSTPKIAAARLHIQQTMARRLAEDAELWGPPGEPITW